MSETKVSVIIPAYNEEQTIGDLTRKIGELYPDFEVIVINDGSTDNTSLKAKEAGAIVYSHPYNIGNGAAIKSGIRIASGEILILMDGDGQHDPEDMKKLIQYFPEYDMVVGSRDKSSQASSSRSVGNTIFNWLATYVAKFRIEDLTSGFRALKTEIAHQFIFLLPNTYSYPTSLTLGVLRDGRSVKYVPITLNSRETGRSDIRIVKDGLKFIMIITKICTLYSPLRIFLPVSFFMFIMGLGYYIFTYVTANRFTNMSALLFTTSIIIFMMGLISEQISQLRFERSDNEKYR